MGGGDGLKNDPKFLTSRVPFDAGRKVGMTGVGKGPSRLTLGCYFLKAEGRLRPERPAAALRTIVAGSFSHRRSRFCLPAGPIPGQDGLR